MNKFVEMKKIRDEIVACGGCPLYEGRTLPVVGEGSHDANLMFVGEGPGANEDKTGKPFCGRSGQILDSLLEHIGLPREDVYITNLVKSRPPKNRDPSPDEIAACVPYLERQMEIIQPKVICPLGRHAMYYLMNRYGLKDSMDSIGKIHGQEFVANTPMGSITIVPLYHPAVAIYNSTKIDELKKDFEVLKQYI